MIEVFFNELPHIIIYFYAFCILIVCFKCEASLNLYNLVATYKPNKNCFNKITTSENLLHLLLFLQEFGLVYVFNEIKQKPTLD